jgi:hypothetical protein
MRKFLKDLTNAGTQWARSFAEVISKRINHQRRTAKNTKIQKKEAYGEKKGALGFSAPFWMIYAFDHTDGQEAVR